jgi:ABC-2 type transport system permease protein
MQNGGGPVGYVDESGLLSAPGPAASASLDLGVTLVPFETEAQARQALDSGCIQAYYLLPHDYRQTSRAKLVYIKEPGDSVQERFRETVRARLLSGQPPEVARRLLEGSHVTVRSADGSRQMSDRDWFNILISFAAGLAFIFAIFTSSGYLMQAVVEEKENRTMEIVLTSVSPAQMMSGKIIGIIGVGLTQILVWAGVAVLAVLAGRGYYSWMQDLRVSPGLLALTALVMAPGFVLVAALMAAIGSTVTEEREGQQVAGLFTLPVMAPYWFAAQLMGNPNGPLAVGLSYFPLTAPVALSIRAGLTTIPIGQLAISLGLLVLSALGALWLAGRAFRLGMLRYGQKVAWREIFER